MQAQQNVYIVPTRDPARSITLIASKKIFEAIEGNALKQAENVRLSYGVRDVVLTPDVHEGYFVPIGSVTVTDRDVIYPGAVGVDISCGMRMILTDLNGQDVADLRLRQELIRDMDRRVPTSTCTHRRPLLSETRFWQVLYEGIDALQQSLPVNGHERAERKRFDTMGLVPGESNLQQLVSEHLTRQEINRALDSLGTLGSGNHFIELELVDTLYPETRKLADTWGLFEGQLVVTVHSGSRNFGKVIADRFIRNTRKEKGLLVRYFDQHDIPVTDPNGQYVERDSMIPYFDDYAGLLAAAATYAAANRHCLQYLVERTFEHFFPGARLRLLYDISHNIAGTEVIDGHTYTIHRKGATRALPARHPTLHDTEWYDTGHPVILPGSMGSASYLMVGTPEARKTYFSINHGAGRSMSRSAARARVDLDRERLIMAKIPINLKSLETVIDETSSCYKDIDEITESVVGAGIARRVARLIPIGVLKGS